MPEKYWTSFFGGVSLGAMIHEKSMFVRWQRPQCNCHLREDGGPLLSFSFRLSMRCEVASALRRNERRFVTE
jgi:hypothetical protein